MKRMGQQRLNSTDAYLWESG